MAEKPKSFKVTTKTTYTFLFEMKDKTTYPFVVVAASETEGRMRLMEHFEEMMDQIELANKAEAEQEKLKSPMQVKVVEKPKPPPTEG